VVRRDLDDAGNGRFGDVLAEEQLDLPLLAIELRLPQGPLGPPQPFPVSLCSDQTFLGPLGNEIAFDLGKEAEEALT
jgi:hypothetical protein